MNPSVEALEPVVRLFARLLLAELDAETAQALVQPPMRDALRELGIEPPDPDGSALEVLAAEYFESLLQPASGVPLIQSLVQEGRHVGGADASLRLIAAAAGLTYDQRAARGTPIDHLGSQLLLFAEFLPRDVAAALELARRHLAWAPSVLRIPVRSVFYGQVRRAVADLIESCLTP